MRYFSLAGVLLCLLLPACISAKKHYLGFPGKIYSEPKEEGKYYGGLEIAGDEVKVRLKSIHWCEIKTKDGVSGWIPSHHITTDAKKAGEIKILAKKKILAKERIVRIKNHIASLEKKVKPLPVSDTYGNLKIYLELLSLAPDNHKYKRKVKYYQSHATRKEKAMARKKSDHGKKPVSSGRDGSVSCVKKYLKQVTKDPDSLKCDNWSKIYRDKKNGWVVRCTYRGKKSFGGYARSTNWFVIRHSKVVEVKPADAYKL
jgi:endonuclease YncB( thermonuclease family)